MADTIFRQLLDKYLTHSLSSSERDELYNMLRQEQYTAELQQHMDEQATAGIIDIEEDPQLRTLIFQRIQQKKSETPVISLPTKDHKSFNWKKIAVAASLIIALATIGYFVIPKRSEEPPTAQTQDQRFKNDVNPGGYKARLTLADGTVVILDSIATGELAKQGGTVVLNKDGQLVYDPKNKSTEVLYNTLTTARGETYATVLADGSKVCLNSASTIKYPVAFNGKERRVEITGEAYFDVKHNDKMPFIVSVNGMEVHDLGTEFNINAYNDEADIKTTLVSGSAEVVKGNKKQLLSPGEQLQVGKANEMSLVKNADIAAATAWKNGIFKFTDATIEQLMRQIARWYDIEIVYEGTIKDHFIVTIPRTVSMINAFKILEETGSVRFRIEGKKVTVLK